MEILQKGSGLPEKNRGVHGLAGTPAGLWQRKSVAQQIVQAGLGAGLGIHPLDNDGSIQAVAATVLGQRAADHHRAGRYAAHGRNGTLYLPAAPADPHESQFC